MTQRFSFNGVSPRYFYDAPCALVVANNMDFVCNSCIKFPSFALNYTVAMSYSARLLFLDTVTALAFCVILSVTYNVDETRDN